MHDIGKLILDDFVIGNQQVLSDLVVNEDIGFDIAEKKLFGLNHASAGADLLESWHFPSELVSSVRWHHDPLRSDIRPDIVTVVHIADMLAYAEGIGAGIDGFLYHIKEDAVLKLGITKTDLEKVVSSAFDKVRELENVFGGK